MAKAGGMGPGSECTHVESISRAKERISLRVMFLC